jgi:hypothetical protein
VPRRYLHEEADHGLGFLACKMRMVSQHQGQQYFLLGLRLKGGSGLESLEEFSVSVSSSCDIMDLLCSRIALSVRSSSQTAVRTLMGSLFNRAGQGEVPSRLYSSFS